MEELFEDVPLVLDDVDAVELLLNSWNFSSAVEMFREHEIDYYCMERLTEDHLKMLFPKIGQQIKFMERHRHHFGSKSFANDAFTQSGNSPSSDILSNNFVILSL